MEYKFLIAFLFVATFNLNFSHGYEENNRFCIHTEPMLLADIEKHVNPIEGDPHCEILATTMTAKEKESFFNTMCKDHGTTHKDDYSFLKLKNGDLSKRGSYHEICSGKTNPLLAWVPYAMIQQNYAQELNPLERRNYIAKATDVDREKTELCYFRQSDLVTNITANLFTCVVMIFEDNFYGLDSHINVLVEIQPIMYEVRNITYMPWFNSSPSYKTMLGKTTLKNPSRETKQIYGSISYAYVEKITVNVSTIYGDKLEPLPILYEHKNAVLELDGAGNGGLNIKDKSFFGRTMDPKSSVKVDVTGQWAEHQRQFTADIYEYFGYNIKRFYDDITHGKANFVKIESTEPVFETIESSNMASITVHNEQNEKKPAKTSERLTEQHQHKHSEVESLTDVPTGSGHPYPGFYPYAVAGAIIIGAVLLVSVINMIRICSKEAENKKYKLART
ncbi:uncharacterized protein LOC119679022 [Teleopsis dalmanni]|uniref:uncharacterized protein LOC119662939 n=1 Tax=Teleopsis dalmanni TaxID=139649 RepID=UPI000D329467|nr:uncharacterized protein LOC119662939 [Teleopsis dalmanni]XP_037947091.1 uncharacterized protein LOC119679022 [Teleopsis dalmanni]